jgi:hypothetical protein
MVTAGAALFFTGLIFLCVGTDGLSGELKMRRIPVIIGYLFLLGSAFLFMAFLLPQ